MKRSLPFYLIVLFISFLLHGCLEEGISLMRENEKAVLIMPSKIAFGKSVQVIPQKLRADWAENGDISPVTRPYASVIYEIELLKID